MPKALKHLESKNSKPAKYIYILRMFAVFVRQTAVAVFGFPLDDPDIATVFYWPKYKVQIK